jgi:hypothetical protein
MNLMDFVVMMNTVMLLLVGRIIFFGWMNEWKKEWIDRKKERKRERCSCWWWMDELQRQHCCWLKFFFNLLQLTGGLSDGSHSKACTRIILLRFRPPLNPRVILRGFRPPVSG